MASERSGKNKLQKRNKEEAKRDKEDVKILKLGLLTTNVDEWIGKLWLEDVHVLVPVYNQLRQDYIEKITKDFLPNTAQKFSYVFGKKVFTAKTDKYSVIKDIIAMNHFYNFYTLGSNSGTQTELQQILASVQRVRANVDEVLGTAGDPGDQTLEEPQIINVIKSIDTQNLNSMHKDDKIGKNNLEKFKNMMAAIHFFAPKIENKTDSDWYNHNVLGGLVAVIRRVVIKNRQLDEDTAAK